MEKEEQSRKISANDVRNYSLTDLSQMKWEIRGENYKNKIVVWERKEGSAPDEFGLFHYPSRLDASIIAVCTQGTARFTMDLKQYEISAGYAFIFPPNRIIQTEQSKDFSAEGLLISTEFLRSMNVDIKLIVPIYMQLCDSVCVSLSPEDISSMIEYFGMIATAVRQPDSRFKYETVQGLLLASVYRFGDILLNNLPDPDTARLQPNRRMMVLDQFLQLLNQHHSTERRVGFYAEKLFLTPKYMSKIIFETSGKTAAEWIDRAVVLEAKTLLRYSQLSIQEIAYHMNFSTQSFFGKYFKRLTGMSPSQYKQQV